MVDNSRPLTDRQLEDVLEWLDETEQKLEHSDAVTVGRTDAERLGRLIRAEKQRREDNTDE